MGMKINTVQLRRNLDRLISDSAELKLKLLRGAFSVFVSTAQKYTPPNAGKKIPAYMYRVQRPVEKAAQKSSRAKTGVRPIIDLKKMAKDTAVRDSERKDYAIKYNMGYRYLVLIDLKGTGRRKGNRRKKNYVRSLDEARRIARIDYRGLLRASWGMGARSPFMIPPVTASLMSKAPKIAEQKSKSEMSLERSARGTYALVLRNRIPAGNSGYEPNAMSKAEYAAKRYMQNELKLHYSERKRI